MLDHFVCMCALSSLGSHIMPSAKNYFLKKMGKELLFNRKFCFLLWVCSLCCAIRALLFVDPPPLHVLVREEGSMSRSDSILACWRRTSAWQVNNRLHWVCWFLVLPSFRTCACGLSGAALKRLFMGSLSVIKLEWLFSSSMRSPQPIGGGNQSE